MSEAAQRPSRRSVLAGAGAGLLALAGCVPAKEPVGPVVDPEVRIRARIAEEVRSLSDRYTAVVAAFPDADAQLVSFAAEHDAHIRALTSLQREAAPGTSSSAPAPPGATAPSPAPAVPTELRAAIQALVVAEQSAARRRSRQARRASPSLARLLASIAACDAAHAVLLTGPGRSS